MADSGCWTRRLDTPDPSSSTHTHSVPGIIEILSLLPVASRVSSYISTERALGKEPIFDLSGIFLEPPHPGPNGGVPLGGLGGGCITRGWRGDFNRWSMTPGRYVHQAVKADQFHLRVSRTGVVHAQVLSVSPPAPAPEHFASAAVLRPLDPATVVYHGLHPRSWTVFEEPVPGVRVTIKQLSPFLPHSYSDASLPCAVFDINVENLGIEEIDASVMFVFQNGYTGCLGVGGHRIFEVDGDQNGGGNTLRGVAMDSSTSQNIPSASSASGAPHSRGSFAIAATMRKEEEESKGTSSITCMERFSVPNGAMQYSTCGMGICCGLALGLCPCCAKRGGGESHATACGPSMHDCIAYFANEGDLAGAPTWSAPLSSSKAKTQSASAAAVCVRHSVPPKATKAFTFSLAWDHPWCNFGPKHLPPISSAPRYYSRFLGRSGCAAPVLAAYALQQANTWDRQIVEWQSTVGQHEEGLGPGQDKAPQYYRKQLCNELYYLSDGGTIWSDTSNGRANPLTSADLCADIASEMALASTLDDVRGGNDPRRDSPSVFRISGREGESKDDEEEDCPESGLINADVLSLEMAPASSLARSCMLICPSLLMELTDRMRAHDSAVPLSKTLGDSQLVGQFLYLEGHEYQMYNTSDVHFYASFALLQLWPHLEYSLQRDFAEAVSASDDRTRVMLGTGQVKPVKVSGCVPHDLGSPSESPWHLTNAYNFQDVSSWRDLGPKFVLQVYRDYLHSLTLTSGEGGSDGALSFLRELYSSCCACMAKTDTYDLDGLGVIKNSNLPDQTYDIWVADGISAYCGGLYIASCRAIAAMASALGDSEVEQLYTHKAKTGSIAYVEALWNGSYLDFDSSRSGHHDSIMSDMCCGQWWTIVCQLEPVLPPKMALSCYRTIFKMNVESFAALRGKPTKDFTSSLVLPDADGLTSFSTTSNYSELVNTYSPAASPFGSPSKSTIAGLCGAVNGMRPNGTIDETCIQSREVWTGTTYGLAAAMLHESYAFPTISSSTSGENFDNPLPSSSTAKAGSLTASERSELRKMAHGTAQGVQDAAWDAYGYFFATPEAYDINGNYRSLGYMRPLSIWAMEFASKTQNNEIKRSNHDGALDSKK